MSAEVTPAVLPARVRSPELTFGPFVFDRNSRFLRKEGLEIPLPPRVLGVLELLLARAGDVVPRQELIDTVWKEAFVTDTSLAEAVSYLRQALGDDMKAPRYIQTVHRRGYRFVAPVSEAAPPAAIVAAEPTQTPAGPGEPVAEPLEPSILNDLLPWSVAILSFIAASSALWHGTSQQPPERPVVRIRLDPGGGRQFDTRAPAIALSRSGAKVAWSACNGSACQLYVRTLDRYLEEQLPGTSGGSAPFFSPDERWLGFFAGGKLKKVWLAGGATPTVITEAAHPLGAVWMLDGRIIFAASPTGGLMQVSENGGNPGVLTTPAVAAGEIAHVFPSAIRGGAALLFTVITSPLRGAPGRLALLSSTRPRGSWQAIVEDVNIGLALRDEYLLFARRHQLHAVAFDKARQAAAGPEQTIGSLLPPHLAVSESGAMVAVDAASVEPPRSPPARWAWVGGAGPDIHEQIEPLLDPQLSPDGSRIAGVSGDVRPDIWIADLQRGTTTRLTYSAGVASPVWSGTADEVFYTSRQAAGFEIRARSLSSDGADRVVLSRQDRHVFPASVSKGGDLAFTETGGPTGSDIGLARRDGTVTLVVQTPFDERGPTLSPDGTLMAFETDETGRPEIAILRLNDSRRMPVSTAGGSGAFWSADGGTLFFARGDDLIRVLVDSDGQVSSPPLVLERLNGSRPVGASRSGAVLVHWTEPPFAPSATLTLEAIKELRRVVGRPTPTIPR